MEHSSRLQCHNRIFGENPAKVTAVGHGFSTGNIVFFQPGSVGAMSNKIGYTLAFYAITVVDVDNFTLNGVDSSAWPAYTGGGIVAKQIRVKAGNLRSSAWSLPTVAFFMSNRSLASSPHIPS